MSQDIHIVQAFSQVAHGGNPAAIVLNGADYSADQRQKLATEIGLSETAFVMPAARASLRLEFYTPTRPIQHCGHATLAAFALLASRQTLGLGVHTHEASDGLHQVKISNNSVMLEQAPASFSPFDKPRAALRALGLPDAAAHAQLPMLVGSTGNRFLLLPLAGPQELLKIKPNLLAIDALSRQHDLIGFYPFALTKGVVTAAARMFAPAYGITEEAATGMAAGPLGAYLKKYAQKNGPELVIAQGAFMKSPSRIVVDVSQPKIWVGGQAHLHETRLLP